MLQLLLRACRERLRLEIKYARCPPPSLRFARLSHTHWFIPAYAGTFRPTERKDSVYRDFVSSYIRGKPDLLDGNGNGNGIEGDTAWNTEVSVILESDLAARRCAEGDYRG